MVTNLESEGIVTSNEQELKPYEPILFNKEVPVHVIVAKFAQLLKAYVPMEVTDAGRTNVDNDAFSSKA